MYGVLACAGLDRTAMVPSIEEVWETCETQLGQEWCGLILAFLRDCCVKGDSLLHYVAYVGDSAVSLRKAFATWRAAGGGGASAARRELPAPNHSLARAVKLLMGAVLRTREKDSISKRGVFLGWRLRTDDGRVSFREGPAQGAVR